MKSRINDPDKMGQLIDFQGLNVDNCIYPTDIDGLIEYRNSEYIILEVKFMNSKVPKGQKLALKRMVDDFTKIGKQAVVFICEHNVKDPETPVIAAKCRVREMYYGDEKRWRKPDKKITVKEAVDIFQQHSTALQKSHKKEGGSS